MFANYTEALFSPADGALTGSTNTFKFTGPDGQDATRRHDDAAYSRGQVIGGVSSAE